MRSIENKLLFIQIYQIQPPHSLHQKYYFTGEIPSSLPHVTCKFLFYIAIKCPHIRMCMTKIGSHQLLLHAVGHQNLGPPIAKEVQKGKYMKQEYTNRFSQKIHTPTQFPKALVLYSIIKHSKYYFNTPNGKQIKIKIKIKTIKCVIWEINCKFFL